MASFLNERWSVYMTMKIVLYKLHKSYNFNLFVQVLFAQLNLEICFVFANIDLDKDFTNSVIVENKYLK